MNPRRLFLALAIGAAGWLGSSFSGRAIAAEPPAVSVKSVNPASLDPQAGGVLLRRAVDRYGAPRPDDDDDNGTPATDSALPARSARVAPLRFNESMLVSFPRPMVKADAFDHDAAEPPVEFSPALASRFLWRSATEGEIIVGGMPAPATMYRLRLRAGLRDVAGAPVDVPAWGQVWPAEAFLVRLSFDPEHQQLHSDHELNLRFSHPVAAAEIVRTVAWRDDRGGTIPFEVVVSEYEKDLSRLSTFTLRPLALLQPDRDYRLVVEGTRCALNAAPLPYTYTFPLGHTRPLVVERVAGRNQPQLGPFLEVHFDQPIAAQASADAAKWIATSPGVKIVRTEIDGPDLRLFGAFQPGARYAVTIAADAARNHQGFGLPDVAHWHATFGTKRPAVILPRSLITVPEAQPLKIDFTQVNTGALHWRLARVPATDILTVQRRLDEYRAFDDKRRAPHTGELILAPTELLVPALRLPVVTEGDFSASDHDAEVARTVEFTPTPAMGGIYLFEISGPTADGRTAGNRALISVNREFFAWKDGMLATLARLFDVTTGAPVAHAKVKIFSAVRMVDLGETDEGGEISTGIAGFRFDREPAIVLVDRGGGAISAHRLQHASFAPQEGETGDSRHPWHQWLFTDRGIYRPGEKAHVKGIVRGYSGDELGFLETGTPVAWSLISDRGDEPVLTGTTQLSATGAWEAELALPDTLKPGRYFLSALDSTCPLKIDEFRAPAFAVEVQAPAQSVDRTSRIRVLSHYFHGAPNARGVVRWRATWSPYTPDVSEEQGDPASLLPGIHYTADDYASAETEIPAFASVRRNDDGEDQRSVTLDGTAVLDLNGSAEISSASPLAPPVRAGGARVRWEIAVVAADGQTVAAAGDQLVPLVPAQPAITLHANHPHELDLRATAATLDGKIAPGTPLTVTIYQLETKTVRELLSHQVVRYLNTPVATAVLTRDVVAPFHLVLPAPETGRYLAVAALRGPADRTPRASTSAYVAGEGEAHFAQRDERSITVTADREDYVPGDVAHLSIAAPFGGKAWITVDTWTAVSSRVVDLAGNAASVDIPITEKMRPDATIDVYLFRPRERGTLAERTGSCKIRVHDPATKLAISTTLASPRVEPRQPVRGTVAVTHLGQPAAGAELTLFAVDEAILTYGHWELPDPEEVFFPDRARGVNTASGLDQFKPGEKDDPLFQKGFLIGDGALGWRSRFVRSRFMPLAFWQGSVKADATGRATFEFPAPDNLTSYRIVAVAQCGVDQFGSGSQHVEVARRLQAEPALPRFVRAGDDVDLRAVLREDAWPELPVTATCTVEGATLSDASSASSENKTLARSVPQPVVFRAHVADDATKLKVHFTVHSVAGAATADEVEDAVEIELPVLPPATLRREAITGEIPATGWSPASAMPAAWRPGTGTADVLVSSSPWLPLLTGLPDLLEYPHGCNEQVSGRILGYAMLADLLRSLPDDGGQRAAEYQRRVEEGLNRLARSQLPNGMMPYWPGQKEPNLFVTIQTAWAFDEAKRGLFPTMRALHEAVGRIIRQQVHEPVSPFLRAFALMVDTADREPPLYQVEALELYRARDALGDDGRVFLALALHRMKIMPDEKQQLMRELRRDADSRAFDSLTFGSVSRTTALRLYAQATIPGSGSTEAEAARLLRTLGATSQNLSTQEHLWTLLAFRAFLHASDDNTNPLRNWTLPWPAPVTSNDGRAAGWFAQPLAGFAEKFSGPTTLAAATPGGSATGTFVLRAAYRLPPPETRVDRGFRVERIVHDLTAPERDGSAAHPFQLGDELAVTFRALIEKPQVFVALDAPLPGAFETLDPEYAQATQRDRLAALDRDHGSAALELSHWEKRDDRTEWYFDRAANGPASFTTLVHVTSAGTFHWPGAEISPMYDARFSGIGEGSTVVVVAK